MKILLSFLSFVFVVVTASASHLLAGQLAVTCADDTATSGILEYQADLVLIRDQQGASLGNSQTVQVGGSGPVGSFTLNKIGSFNITVGMRAVEIVYYQGMVNLLPNTNHIVSWELCCRPPGVLNIPNSNSQSMYYYNVVNTSSGCNSSPFFLTPPAMLWPDQVPWASSLAAYDFDGDSLIYSLGVPNSAANTPIPGYTLPTTLPAGPAVIDSLTGLFTMTASGVGVYSLVYEVTSYDAGGLMNGVLRRESMVSVVSPPSPNLINITPPSSVVNGTHSFMVGAPDTLLFTATSDVGLFAEYFVPSTVDTSNIYFNVDLYKQGANADVSFAWDPQPGQEGEEFPVVIRFHAGDYRWDESFNMNAVQNDISVVEESRADMRVFPNPVEGEFTIAFDRPVERVTIVDPSGRIVKEESVDVTMPFKTVQAPVESGVYFIQIHDASGNVHVRSLVVK